MLKLRPKMFDESSKSHAPKELWKLILIFLFVFLIILLAESMIPAIVGAKPMVEAINELTNNGNNRASFDDSMEAAKDVAMKPSILLLSLFCTVFGTLISIMFCRLVEMRHVSSMGARGGKRRAVVHYAEGMLIGIVMMTTMTLLTVACGANTIKQLSGVNYLMILLYFVGFFIQGMSEEFVFRGYFMTTLGAKHHSYIAIAVSSVAFGMAHISNPGISPLAMLNLILYGVFAAVYMIYFDDIWGVCGIHSLWNFMQGNVYGITVSGGAETESVLRTVQKSSNSVLTGGKFGIEGSIFATLVLTAGIAIVLYLQYRREKASPAAVEVPVTAETEPAESSGTE